MTGMVRPTSKAELLEAANKQYGKLLAAIDSMSEVEQSAPFDFGPDFPRKEAHWDRDANLRDVLIHMHEWHRLLLLWVSANQDGQATPFLPAPYNWKNYGQMNVEIRQKHQGTSLQESKNLLQTSHDAVMQLIAVFTNEELFEKKYFTWTGSTSLGSYCVSATSSHYDWALKKIREHLKAFRKRQHVSP